MRYTRRIAAPLRQLWIDLRESVTVMVITLCTGAFLALATLDLSGLLSRSQSSFTLGLSYVGIVHRLWLFQFLSAPLMHVDLTHLAFNMLTLWMLGPSVEAALGRRRYALFSAFCAACSMAGFLLWNWGTGTMICGYSGVIFGILAAQAILFPDRVLYIYAFFPLKMKYAVLVLAAVELYLTVLPDRSGIAHAAHLLGAMGAWAFLQVTRWWAVPAGLKAAWPKPGPMVKLAGRKHRKDIPWEL